MTLTSLGAKTRWDDFRFQARLDSKSTAFKDMSKDYQSTLLDVGVTYPWAPWVFSFNFQNINQKYKNPDAASNLVLENKKDTISLGCKYAFSKTSILGLDLKQIKNASNDATKVFQANRYTMQYIWMF